MSEPQGNTVASGSTSCPCSSTTLFGFEAGSSPLGVGTYQVVAEFNGEHNSSSSDGSGFSVVDGSSGGAVAAMSGSLLVFAVFALKKSGSRSEASFSRGTARTRVASWFRLKKVRP
ncbi:MAG: hypothetical protein JRN24_01990 [Nitrososphaerota archaeon]|nr:hypothetical protein [Nitrososphaerota archaeon]